MVQINGRGDPNYNNSSSSSNNNNRNNHGAMREGGSDGNGDGNDENPETGFYGSKLGGSSGGDSRGGRQGRGGDSVESDGPALTNKSGLIIRLGHVYDILDQNDRWYAAKVTKIHNFPDSDRKIYVEYINFESHYDCFIYDIDHRVAQFKSQTYFSGGPIRIGQVVQCCDPYGKWLMAFVTDIVNANEIRVHYKGYVELYDEFVTPQRIRPLDVVVRKSVAQSAMAQNKRVLFKNPAASNGIKYSRNNGGSFGDYRDSRQANMRSYNGSENGYDSDENHHPNSRNGLYNNNNNNNNNQGYGTEDDSSPSTYMDDDSRKRMLQYNSTPYERYVNTLRDHRLSIVRVDGDGNCLFRSISHQVYGDDRHHNLVRQACMDYMEQDAVFFSQFIEGGLDMFPFYIAYKRRDACWGDDPEIQAMCEIYGRPAEIWAYDSVLGARKLRTFHEGGGSRYVTPMRVSYYGGGHYDSLYSSTGDTERSFARPHVGEIERQAMQRLRARLAIGGARGGGEQSSSSSASSVDSAAIAKAGYNEQDAVNIAIEMSRQSWLNANCDGVEAAFLASSESKDMDSQESGDGLKPSVEREIIKAAEERSADEYASDAILQQALELSKSDVTAEDYQLKLAMELSVKDNGIVGDRVLGESLLTDDEALKIAMEESLKGKPKELDFSALLGEMLPDPPDYMVSQVMQLGFSRHESVEALRACNLDPDAATVLLLDRKFSGK